MKRKYSADFETTTDANDCRVWAWSICNIDNFNDIKYGLTIDTFIQEIYKLANCDLYFHNLRFDSQFIIYYLLANGFTYDKQQENKKALTFSTLINGENQIYSMEIVFDKKCYRSKKIYKRVVIYDSLKKLPFPVKKIAKDFQLPIQKLDLDYVKARERGHMLTEDEAKYLTNDVEIMARALNIQFDQGLSRMTIGADALNNYKKIIGEENFKHYFPTLDGETDSYLRKAYHGGWTYVNPKFQNIDIGAGKVYDVNSLYPWAMRYKKYPVGLPFCGCGQYDQDDDRPLYIQKFACNFKLKPGKLPLVQIKNSSIYCATEYLTESAELTILYMCNVDLKLFLEHYDVWDMQYIKYWSFCEKEDLFSEYIDSWAKVKAQSKGAIRQIAKLMLNNLYGKFATSPHITEKKPVLEDGVIKYVVENDFYKDAVYIPVGVFCTAYAREKTIRTAQSIYDRFMYADTDSLHVIGEYEPKELNGEVHDTQLGKWKNESNFVRARYIKAKSYIEEQQITKEDFEKSASKLDYERNGNYYHLDVKCAGMNDAIKEKVTFDNFHIGFSSNGKLVPKNVPGGVILVDTEFTIKNLKMPKLQL